MRFQALTIALVFWSGSVTQRTEELVAVAAVCTGLIS
jgi:hypothetical protein